MKRLLSLIGLAATGCWLFAASLTGYVVDEQGEPLIGAAVKVANSTVGTITDYDGKFELTDILPGTTVEVSYMGYGAHGGCATPGRCSRSRLWCG